jgi:hypothetical protein
MTVLPSSEQAVFSAAYRRRFLLRLGGALLLTILLTTLGLYLHLNRPFGGDYLVAITELDRLRLAVRWAVTISVLVQLAVFSLLIFLISLFWTHKIAGPLYRLRLTFERLADGDWTPMAKVRDGDQLQGIPSVLNEGLTALRKNAAAREKELELLRDEIEKIPFSGSLGAAQTGRRLGRIRDRLRKLLADDYWRFDE